MAALWKRYDWIVCLLKSFLVGYGVRVTWIGLISDCAQMPNHHAPSGDSCHNWARTEQNTRTEHTVGTISTRSWNILSMKGSRHRNDARKLDIYLQASYTWTYCYWETTKTSDFLCEQIRSLSTSGLKNSFLGASRIMVTPLDPFSTLFCLYNSGCIIYPAVCVFHTYYYVQSTLL